MDKIKRYLNNRVQEKSLTMTIAMICVMAILFTIAYFQISSIIEQRSINRMEEGVNTVVDEITSKLNRDSKILNAAAEIISNSDKFDVDSIRETMSTFSPLMETREIRVLLPDNTIIKSNGDYITNNKEISFDEEVEKGEYVSNRVKSAMFDDKFILRHFVPIKKNGETVAILYGITVLDELPEIMNVDNIYNASANAFIIDTENGEFIMDTLREELGNFKDARPLATENNVSWEEMSANLLEGKKGYIVYKSAVTKEWTYMYYAPAGINQWSIAVSVPEREAFASVYAIQKVFWVIAAFAMVVIAIYYHWVRKNAQRVLKSAVERAVLEEKLHKAEAAERAKTMFLSNMSHDIRTPMNAIIGFTTLAEKNLDNKERIQEYLEKINSSSSHLLSLINDILDMSRIESGHLNIEEKECTISEIFKDMRNIIQSQMQAKQLNFFMDTIDVVDEDIYCDKLHLNQVLLNLLSNAIKFTPAGGDVSMIIKQIPCDKENHGAYEIRVKDTGIGMSQEFAKRVFDAFEREKTSTVSGIQGTGLGMAITKSIVDAMGGTIRVETQQNVGTEFIINLNFRLSSEPRIIEVIQELKGLRALVVDDNFNTCDSVSKMLMQIGMRAEWTLHGKEAILRAKQAIEIEDEFFVYIVDWALPDLNGGEVARQLRAIVGNDVPIVLLSAYDLSLIEEEAKDAGVTAFCNKPIFISELCNTLMEAIGKNETTSSPDETTLLSTDVIGKRILLVEDNEINLEIAEEILEESGFVIETADDGTVAVEKVKNSEPGHFDLILMDIQMPVMNGYEATKAIRSLDNPDLANIPIVAMTANAFEEDRQNALKAGMNDHIAKPIDIEKMMTVINSVLHKDK